MMISSATFVILFILTAMAGTRFYYSVVLLSAVYIGGTILATEISKFVG